MKNQNPKAENPQVEKTQVEKSGQSEKILPVIIGIASTKLSEAEKELFTKYPVYGFILFERNLVGLDRQQLIDLNKSLKDLYPDRDADSVKIFVDQEGGRVARIKPPLAQEKYPAANYFAELYQNSTKREAKQECHDNYLKIMKEAKELGFDSLCAPVCDLHFKGASDVIGDRSFGSDPLQVIELAGAAIEGIRNAGGIPFIKHIPGHGRALVDSHYQLPHVDVELEELDEKDFLPFKELAARYNLGSDSRDSIDETDRPKSDLWGMTAHIIYKCIDADTPLTLSKKGIDYIRENIFNGIIVSDDIGMLALHGEIGQRKLEYSKLRREFDDLHSANEVKDELIFILKNLSGNVSNAEHLANSEICNRIDACIEGHFSESLGIVTKATLAAGCDYVLHCSGEIKEIEAVLLAADSFHE